MKFPSTTEILKKKNLKDWSQNRWFYGTGGELVENGRFEFELMERGKKCTPCGKEYENSFAKHTAFCPVTRAFFYFL